MKKNIVCSTNISSRTRDFKTASLVYQTSRQGTNVLVEAVKGVDVFDPAQHIETLWAARKHHVKTKVIGRDLPIYTLQYFDAVLTNAKKSH